MNVDIYDGSVFSFCSQAIIKLKVLFTMNAISELSQLALWPHLPEDHCTQRVVPPPAEWSWPTPTPAPGLGAALLSILGRRAGGSVGKTAA